MYFERHTHDDPDLPVYFSLQRRSLSESIYDLHWHETAEWILVTDGQVEVRINETVNCYQAGDLIVISPHYPHSFRAVGGDTSYYVFIPDNSIYTLGNVDPRAIRTAPCIDDDEIKEHYRRVIREFEEKGDCYKSVIKSTIVLMTALLIRRYRSEEASVHVFDDNAMRITKEAIRYMEEHYSEEISGEALAASLGFSRSYVCHVISKVTKQSFTENLLYIRCRKAKELLRKGVPVGEVVFRVGFKNTSYFCRVYKRLMGVSPSAHRRQ